MAHKWYSEANLTEISYNYPQIERVAKSSEVGIKGGCAYFTSQSILGSHPCLDIASYKTNFDFI